jgi:hypothetical protein
MTEIGSHDLSELLKENLRAGRRFYYLIVAVVLFLVGTLIENDPARVPALKAAIDACSKYRDASNLATGAWDELVHIVKGSEKTGDPSYIQFYEQATTATVNWPAMGDCRPADERKEELLSSKITRAWSYLEAVNADGASIISMSTDTGGVELILPTDHPAFTIRTAYLQCFASLAEDIQKKGRLRVQATTAGAGKYEAQVLPLEASAAGTVSVEDTKTSVILKNSPAFGHLMFALNRDKLSDTYFKDLATEHEEVRSSLNKLGLWETVTSAAFNPSVQFKGRPYATTLIRDDALFNDTSLDKAADSLQEELRTRAKKLKIPLTSYEARVDVAVVLTGVVLLFLQLAYMFTLRNVSALAHHASKESTAFFPWPIFWETQTLTASTRKVLPLRVVVVALAFAHCFVTPAVLVWLAVSMLRFGPALYFEFAIAISCFLATGFLGYLCFACIRKVDRFLFQHHKVTKETSIPT